MDKGVPIQELARRVLHGLAMEWQLTAGALSGNLQRRLRPPLLRFGDLKARLGQWDAQRREICLSRALLDQPWEALRGVLRHEMAHQLVTEGFDPAAQRPHGEAFQEACRMLRADPSPASTLEQLSRPMDGNPPDAQNRARERIGKLLALAGSANPHEAEAAMLKAHELMALHHRQEIGNRTPRRFSSRFVGRPALRYGHDAYALAHLLFDFYFVAGLWVPAFVLERGKMGRVLEISGTCAHLENALYVHAFVTRFIAMRWEEFHPVRGQGRARRTDFALGVIAGLREKLSAAVGDPALPDARGALVALPDRQLATYFRERYPRTVRYCRRGGRLDPAVLAHGTRLGRSLVIHRAVTARREWGNGGGNLLPGGQ